MVRCAMVGCGEVGSKNYKMYRFPKKKLIHKQWIVACRRTTFIDTKYARVCSKHFSEAQFNPTKCLKEKLLGCSIRSRNNLKEEAVPDIHLPVSAVWPSRDRPTTSTGKFLP